MTTARRHALSTAMVIMIMFIVTGCGKNDGSSTDSNATPDADSDADSDSDTDTDSDSDSDSDTDSDADSDSDTDSDTDTDSDSDTVACPFSCTIPTACSGRIVSGYTCEPADWVCCGPNSDGDTDTDSDSDNDGACEYDCLPHCTSWGGTAMEGTCDGDRRCCRDATIPDTDTGSETGNDTGTGTEDDTGTGTGPDTGTGATVVGPCDIYDAAGTSCVAAHSTIRALYGSYDGPLYEVRRSDNQTRDIGVLSPGGFADAAAQDTFCQGSTCVFTRIYDQTGNGNFLEYQGEGSSIGGRVNPAVATNEPLTAGGHNVYSLYIKPSCSYWHDGSNSGMPKGSEPQGVYMVTSGTHVNGGCCFDYGNSSTSRMMEGGATMDAINFSVQCWFGGCQGGGPWVQADLEGGLYPGGSQSWNNNQKSFSMTYVTAMEKNNGTTEMALRGGDAQNGPLSTMYQGGLPPGYSPMRKQGGIILGSGGDCCKINTNLSEGTFYEGAIVAGYPSNETDDAIQENIVSAGYGR